MILPWREVPYEATTISTSLTPDEAHVLVRLASYKQVLEVGSAYGYSTLIMGSVAQHVLAVDPHVALDSLDTIRHNLADHGRGNVTIAVGYSQILLPALYLTGAHFDLAFIDGDHSKAAVTDDVLWGMRLLKPGGTLACHDYGEDSCPDVRSALDCFGEPDRVVDTLWIQEYRS